MNEQTIQKPAKKSKRVDKSLLIRMSAEERAIFDERLAESGYAAAGAFVRDYIINAQPQQKIVIMPQVAEAANLLGEISTMVNDGVETNLILKKILKVYGFIVGNLGGIDIGVESEEGEGYDF